MAGAIPRSTYAGIMQFAEAFPDEEIIAMLLNPHPPTPSKRDTSLMKILL